MAIEVTSGNSTLIQSQVSNLLVQPLEQASTFLAAGPVVLDSSSPSGYRASSTASPPDSSPRAPRSATATLLSTRSPCCPPP